MINVKNRLFKQNRSKQKDFEVQEFQKTIHDLKSGESAKIKSIIGGKHFIGKAESIGIREGVQITKVSTQMMHGPVTVKVGQTQIAIGHRMANKIIIEK